MLFGSRLSLRYRFRKWVGSLWNQFDVALYLIFLVAIALRFLLPPAGGDFRWVRALYSVALVLSYLRLLQFFYAIKSVGPKVIMIQKMVSGIQMDPSTLAVKKRGKHITANQRPYVNEAKSGEKTTTKPPKQTLLHFFLKLKS